MAQRQMQLDHPEDCQLPTCQSSPFLAAEGGREFCSKWGVHRRKPLSGSHMDQVTLLGLTKGWMSECLAVEKLPDAPALRAGRDSRRENSFCAAGEVRSKAKQGKKLARGSLGAVLKDFVSQEQALPPVRPPSSSTWNHVVFAWPGQPHKASGFGGSSLGLLNLPSLPKAVPCRTKQCYSGF
ncbi:hypothetical protein A6R68_08400 [Neotoma lepida]|uniref:Uncharacterized protein n=1 Tax=Neotoma lepida TaxID=56216 RepID=A0A1A6G3V1_NEOLE|nr:hypothetical protein A6R68_08400 [Neotoma lepida]